MRVFYVISLFLLINAQVNSLPAAKDEDDWSEKFAQNILSQLTELQLKEMSLQETESAVLPQCYKEGCQQLLQLRHATIEEFFKCDRLKEKIKDIGEICKETFEVSVDVGKYVLKLVDNIVKCYSGNKLSEAICIIKTVWEFATEVKDLKPIFKEYTLDVKRLFKQVKEIFQYCANPKNEKMNQHVALILKQTQMCL